MLHIYFTIFSTHLPPLSDI